MRRIAFIAVICAAALCASGPVFCEDFSIRIVFDVEVDSRAYMQGDPVVVSLVASNPKAMNAYYADIAEGKGEGRASAQVTLGTPAEPWTTLVKFAVAGPDGSPRAVAFSATAPEQSEVALGAQNFAECYFFIASEETAKLKEGAYSIKAVIKDVESNTITLNVVTKEREPSAGKGSVPQFLKYGRYHLLRGDFQKAAGYGYKMLAADEHSLEGLNLLGDAQLGLAKYKEAYETFDKAIREFIIKYPPSKDPSSQENPPDLFFEKRNKAKRMLTQP